VLEGEGEREKRKNTSAATGDSGSNRVVQALKDALKCKY